MIGPLNFNIEVGALTIIDTYTLPNFTRVNFTQTFNAPPLVFTLPTIDGSHAAAHRIRNVTSDGFDIMTLEPDSEDGPHIAMSLNYLAVEPGVHDLPGGRKLIAGTVQTDRVQAYANAGGGIGWENVGFGGVFSQAPAVLAQIQTMVNEQEAQIPSRPSRPWLTTAVSRVRTNDMRIALERSESAAGSVTQDETIAYFAVEPISRLSFKDSNNRTVDMEVIRTAELLQGWGTCSSNRVDFSQPWPQVPVVLATKNTRDGDAGSGDGEGGWLRRCSTTTTYTELQVDEVRMGNVGDGNRTHNTRERAGVVAFSDNFVTSARQLDHFRIGHDGLGVAGVPETVTITACTNASCSQLYTGSVTITLSPADANTFWSGSGVMANQVTFTGGSQVVALNRNTAGTLNLGLSSTPLPLNATRCYVAGVQDCEITFAATAFDVTLPDQVSAGTSVGTVSVPSCWSDFQSRTVQVDVDAQTIAPVWAGPDVTVNGVSLSANGAAATVDLAFDANCVAPLQVSYADAGEIGINVGFVGSGSLNGLTMSGSDSLVFYPAVFDVQVTNTSSVPLNASAPGTSPVHPAGAAIILQVRALNSAGAVTQQYQLQPGDQLLAYVQRPGPTTGFDGLFNMSGTGNVTTRLGAPSGPADYSATNIGSGSFNNGVYTHNTAYYSEVGLVTLYVMDTDFMGHAVASSPLQVGRFIPAGFQAAPVILNRASTPGCGGGSFTYMGEGLRLSAQLTALNARGDVTRNYQGSYAPMNGSGFSAYSGSVGNTIGAEHSGTNLSNRLNLSSVSLGVPWAAGVATLDVDLSLTALAAPDGPFNGTSLGLAFTDSDGAAVQGLNLDVNGDGADDHLNLGSTGFRSGRLAIGNAHGSELRDLRVPLVMQYFDGPTNGFVTNTQDDCTPVASTVLSDADAGDSLLVGDSCIVDNLGASGANACTSGTPGDQYRGTALAGEYVVSLAAPGAGRTGGLRVTPDAPTWAEFDWVSAGRTDPVGLATFGIYNRNTGIIYQRELR